MSKFSFVLLGVLCGVIGFVEPKTDRVICYYGSWANYRNGNGKYTAENIDPNLCTHVIYTFLGIESDGRLKILDTWLELSLRNLERFNALKKQNPNLKTIIAVGGWNEGSTKYSNVASDPAKRATLISSAINVLDTYGFDGFDIDWEYPAQRGGSAADKQNFAILLKEFREAFDKRGYILTAAVAAAPNAVDISYDVPALSKYLDSINVMAYDLHGSYDGVTGANAPLYPSSVDLSPSARALTVDASIRGWIARGADPQKISMGLPLYGRTYTLSNPNSNGVGALVSNSGTPGPYTQEPGMLGYLEICELQKQGGWSVNWDDNTKTPYAYKGNQWVGYDNARSIEMKVEYAKSLNLGGLMIWSLETADFNGICGDKYPILTIIKNALNKNSQTTPLPEPTPDQEIDPAPKPDENKNDNAEKQDNESGGTGDGSKSNIDRDESNKSKESKQNSKESSSDESEESKESKESQESGESKETKQSEESKGSEESDNRNDKDSKDSACEKLGLFRNKKDCSSFYYCVPAIRGLQKVDFKCGDGLVFDEKSETCNFRFLVNCDS